jgi:hypothetical protein
MFSSELSAEGPYNGSLSISQGSTTAVTFATGNSGPSFTVTYRWSDISLDAAVHNQVVRCSIQGISTGTFSITL